MTNNSAYTRQNGTVPQTKHKNLGRHELLFRTLTWNMGGVHWEFHWFSYAPRITSGTEFSNHWTRREKHGREKHCTRWSPFQNEEVQHEEHEESDPGKQESRRNDCISTAILFLLTPRLAKIQIMPAMSWCVNSPHDCWGVPPPFSTAASYNKHSNASSPQTA